MGIKLLYIDLFCGAGGTSTGIERAELKETELDKVNKTLIPDDVNLNK